jgi:hypothetical protein
MIYETDTNRVLVWDNAAWVMIADTDTPPGMQLVASGTLSGTSRNFEGCFTSEFRNYRIVLDGIARSDNSELFFRYLLNSTAQQANNYYWSVPGFAINGNTNNLFSQGSTVGTTGINSDTGNGHRGNGTMEIFNPFTTETKWAQIFSVTQFWGFRSGAVAYNSQTAFNGIQFLSNGAATMTGNVAIYGYRN